MRYQFKGTPPPVTPDRPTRKITRTPGTTANVTLYTTLQNPVSSVYEQTLPSQYVYDNYDFHSVQVYEISHNEATGEYKYLVNKNVKFSDGKFRHYFSSIQHKYTANNILYIEPDVTTILTAYESLSDIIDDIHNIIVQKMFIGTKETIKIHLKRVKNIKWYVHRENKTILYEKPEVLGSTTLDILDINEKKIFMNNINKHIKTLKSYSPLTPKILT